MKLTLVRKLSKVEFGVILGRIINEQEKGMVYERMSGLDPFEFLMKTEGLVKREGVSSRTILRELLRSTSGIIRTVFFVGLNKTFINMEEIQKDDEK